MKRVGLVLIAFGAGAALAPAQARDGSVELSLAMRPDVQKELALNSSQKQKIELIARNYGFRLNGGFAPQGGARGQGGAGGGAGGQGGSGGAGGGWGGGAGGQGGSGGGAGGSGGQGGNGGAGGGWGGGAGGQGGSGGGAGGSGGQGGNGGAGGGWGGGAGGQGGAGGGAGGNGGQGGNGGGGYGSSKFVQQRNIRFEITGLLSDSQGQRFYEIYLQTVGYASLLEPSIQRDVKLSTDQIRQVGTLVARTEAARYRLDERVKEGLSANDYRLGLDKLSADLNKSLGDVLTKDQAERFKSLQGKPFPATD